MCCIFAVHLLKFYNYLNVYFKLVSDTSTEIINQMCSESQIILLQEHWLYPDELPLHSQLNPNFGYSFCLDDKFLSGRPFAGVGILWQKTLFTKLKND